MDRKLRFFSDEIARCRDIVGLSEKLRSLVGPSLRCDDLLRSALVFGVGALDNYVHDAIVDALVEVFFGSRRKSAGIDALQLSASFSLDIDRRSTGYEAQLACRLSLRSSLSRKTFQRSSDIAAGLKMVCDQPFWATRYGKGSSAEVVRKELDLIVNRRNKIVHEADLSDAWTGEKWPIDEPMTLDALRHIESVVVDIFQFVNSFD